VKPFIRNTPYTGPLQAAVLDWAGTAVDYGCMGPAAVFVDVFDAFGIRVTVTEARQFMGLEKKDHIRAMCALPGVATQWKERHGHAIGEADVDAIYARTEPMMVDTIARHADPIPGLSAFVEGARERGLKIGSSTGYTRPMMDVLVPAAAGQGYTPDAIVCSSDVPAGRPSPFMGYLNAVQLGVYPLEAVVKIGDTVADIQEGLNAGMWTIGITLTGNEMGLTEAEAQALDPEERRRRVASIEERFRAAGAHYVAGGIGDCLPLLDAIEKRLAQGEQPL